MARSARVVVPGLPHHIVQRGNRLQKVFFSDEDKQAYLTFLTESALKHTIEVWAYCLMDNHVHLIVVPENEKNLSKAIGEVHVRYTRMINFREGWRGYLWQGRFSSFCLNRNHLFAAVRYVETNPVRAGIVQKAEDYRWSSALSHVNKERSPLLTDNFLTSEIVNWSEYLSEHGKDKEIDTLRKHASTGKPYGDEEFIGRLEKERNQRLRKAKPGPKIRCVSPELYI